jgi:hypothetical protein
MKQWGLGQSADESRKSKKLMVVQKAWIVFKMIEEKRFPRSYSSKVRLPERLEEG